MASETGKQSARAAPGRAAQSARASRAARTRAAAAPPAFPGVSTCLSMESITLRACVVGDVFGLHASVLSRTPDPRAWRDVGGCDGGHNGRRPAPAPRVEVGRRMRHRELTLT